MQRIHGLCIASDRILPGLPSDDAADTPDVRVTFTNTVRPLVLHAERYRSDAPPSADAALVVSDVAPDVIAFRYSDGTAADVDSSGDVVQITAVIAPDQTIDDFVAYLYGAILGFVLRNRGVLALHASAIAVDDAAVLFVGTQGAGKSTTAAALVLRGCSAISDDLTALECSGDEWMAHPAFDFLRIWPSSEPMLYGASGVLDPLSPGWDKRRLPLSANQFVMHPMRVKAVYLLSAREDDNAPRVEHVEPRDALLTLVTESYANYLLSETDRGSELSQIGALLQTVPVRRLVPSSNPAHLQALCDLILGDVRGER